MQLHFFGATRTTTGSMYLLEINGRRILLECGLYQGPREESIERNSTFPFDPATIDVAVLSHAHIDHCGNFPNLCRRGFNGNIFCTHATRDLASIMLEDSAEIQESDAEYLNKKRVLQGLPPVQPLYTVADADKTVQQFVSVNYDRPMTISDGVSVTFRDAGHILGAAQVVFDITEGTRKFRYLFTGDIGRGGDAILRDPAAVTDVDFLQIESTYGNRLHGEPTGALDQIGKLVREAIARRGKVIIPAFSVGRTQTLVYALHRMIEADTLPPIPIFVDSPLSVNATEVFRLHPECFNADIYRFLREKENPFGMDNLTYIRQSAHSKKLNDLDGPAIIISSSGMCEAGRIRHHLKNHIEKPANLILFVGFCAANTLGSRIIAGERSVNILGKPHHVRAQVAKLDAFSGHADMNELDAFAARLTGDIRKIFVIHGEEEQALPFAERLRVARPKAEVIAPHYRDSVTL